MGELYYDVKTSYIGIEIDSSGIYGNKLRKLLEQLEANSNDRIPACQNRNNRIHDLVEWVVDERNESSDSTICFTAVNLSKHFSEFVDNLILE